MEVLDVLIKARNTVADNGVEFDFDHWSSCACGHIYHAAKGDWAVSDVEVIQISEAYDNLYADALELIIQVNDLEIVSSESTIFDHRPDSVSNAVSELARHIAISEDGDVDTPDEQSYREATLRLLDEAIEVLVAEQERRNEDKAHAAASEATVEVVA